MGKGRGMLDGLRKSKKQKEAEKGAAAEKQERDQKRADEKVEEQTLSYQRHSDRPPNTLRITVIRAKDLQVMDGGMFSKGGSDPFPTCAIEGKKAKGTVKKKCLAPIWLEVFDLPAEDPDSVFTFQIDDHDLVGASDFMGLCRVRLGSLSDEKAHRKWHPLGNVKGEVDEIPRGEVELCLRWCHEKHRAYELPKEFKEGEKPLHEKEAANELHVLLAPSAAACTPRRRCRSPGRPRGRPRRTRASPPAARASAGTASASASAASSRRAAPAPRSTSAGPAGRSPARRRGCPFSNCGQARG